MFKMETEPESSPEIEEFILGWKNPKMQLPNIFNDLLQQKELIDVTLSAEGCLFGAHRLILSAFSPYFRQLFTQIPYDQKAYVVLANVSASILKDLITFIYCGEVNVRRENLGELLQTGQLLNIKGLADVKHSTESKSKPDKCSRLNSGTIIKNNDSTNIETTSIDVNHLEQLATASSSDSNLTGVSDDLKSNVFELNNNNNNIIWDGVNNQITKKGTQSMARLHNKHWQGKRTISVIHDPQTINDAISSKKCSKLTNDSPLTHTVMADIRTNEFGRENLFFKGFKFYRQITGTNKVRWICMKHSSKRCKAAISTMVVNHIQMMKVLNAEHSHDA